MMQEYDVRVLRPGHFVVWAESEEEANAIVADMDEDDLTKAVENVNGWDDTELDYVM